MPIHKMLSIQKMGDKETNLALVLAMHCAPLMKGLAIASVLTLNKDKAIEICRLLKETDISCYFLCAKGEKTVLFLYRRQELLDYLQRECTKEFLQEYGYEEVTIYALMRRLSERVQLHRNGEIDYPHEIGIFLGYPLPDVKGFIENEGKNCKYLGYWKVYHNVREAVKLFCRFDEQREKAVRDVVMGKTIHEIVV